MNRAIADMVQVRELMCQIEHGAHGSKLRKEVDRLRRKIPAKLLRSFDHMAEHGHTPIAMLSGSGACEGCHLRLTLADLLAICRTAGELHRCPHCGCFIYSPSDLLKILDPAEQLHFTRSLLAQRKASEN